MLTPLLRNNGRFKIVVASGLTDIIDRVPQQNRDEFNLCANISAQQKTAAISRLPADSRQQFRFQHRLVRVGMFWQCVSMPQSRNHFTPPNAPAYNTRCSRMPQNGWCARFMSTVGPASPYDSGFP